ncbi:type I restriction endonuclease subunit M [Porphyrobacter algicida]|uniref:Type I restriction endonuclease subunit M n=1 Tax=Qipengyuania algicida TaxID=1836209 RepID=A0A845ALJ3_9SPHN|nr:type I restriction endonuclease subunit M [Qipengyuania algicida]MXP29735.1 type I restriction endonuclease subunit M [Qipengyuania algicida]
MIAKEGHILTPGRYVGSEAIEDDGVPFEQRFGTLKGALIEQFAESSRLEALVMSALGAANEDE